MEPSPPLTPCLIGDGTVTSLADMARALETVEAFAYRYLVDGECISEGRGTLVKILADDVSSTMLVNGCLFLNVASFRYVNFRTDVDGGVGFELHADGSVLELAPVDDPEMRVTRPVIRLIERDAFDPELFVRSDDEDEE